MKEELEIREKLKLLPIKLKARAETLYQLFQILREVAAKSAGLRARIISNPFTVYREKDYDSWGNEFWKGKLIDIYVDDEGELVIAYCPKCTGKVGPEVELFEIMLAFEEQEKRFLEWLSEIISPLSGDETDFTAEFIGSISTKLQEKAERIYCYRYEGKVYPKTYLKFRKLDRTERATPAFSMEVYDYNTNKLLLHIYFNSTTEIIEGIKHLIEGFQYLGRKATEEFPF